MSEIRRKLVIVGDGACGKVFLSRYSSQTFLLMSALDLFVDSFLQRNVPRGIFLFSPFFPCTVTIFITSGLRSHRLRELRGRCRS